MTTEHLLQRYNCGPVKLAGGDNALYERHLTFDQVIPVESASMRDKFEAIARSTRDVLSQRWLKTEQTYQERNAKRVYYLSLEFLMGRALANNIINLMLDLQQSLGLAFLFVSHDMAVVERVSHRVAVMYLGEIVEIGPRSAIFGNPQHDYTKKLMAAVPVPDPDRRHQKRKAIVEELRSPIRPVEYEADRREYRTVSPGHLVIA